MPRIRNNNASFTAAAVSDTAGVATTQRWPLHPASQGPLSPVGVVDTSAAAARRVTVSDTATVVVPCLKKTLNYSSRQDKAQVKSILRVIAEYDNLDSFETSVDAALFKMQHKDKHLFENVSKAYKSKNLREELEDALAQYAAGNTVAWETQWKDVIKASLKEKTSVCKTLTDKVDAYYHNDNQAVATEARTNSTKVSFDTVTVVEYVLTKEDRLHKLSKRKQLQQRYRVWVPSTKYERNHALPSDQMKVGKVTARVLDSSVAVANHKQWLDNGNKEALALDQQSLPEAPQSTVVSDTTAVHATTASASVTETVAQSTQSPVVSDTTEVQSTQTVVLDTTIQPSVVSDTTGVQSTEPAVVDTAVPAQPLRRSARIAAQNGSGSRVASTRGRNRVATVPLRRTTRKGAAKPKGFYKV